MPLLPIPSVCACCWQWSRYPAAWQPCLPVAEGKACKGQLRAVRARERAAAKFNHQCSDCRFAPRERAAWMGGHRRRHRTQTQTHSDTLGHSHRDTPTARPPISKALRHNTQTSTCTVHQAVYSLQPPTSSPPCSLFPLFGGSERRLSVVGACLPVLFPG